MNLVRIAKILSSLARLLPIHEMAATVLLPTGFVVFGTERPLFAVADGIDPVCGYAGGDQPLFHSVRTLVAQGNVVFDRASFVTMTFNREIDGRMLREERGIGLQGSILIRTNIRFVEIEIDVLDVLVEQVLIRDGWSRWRRRRGWLGHSQSCCRLLRSAWSFGGQMIGRGFGRRYGLRAIRLNGTNAVYGNVGSVRSLPG